MGSHKWKKWGFIVSAIGLALMIAERLTKFTFIKELKPEQHYAVFVWLTFLGLVIIMYSKEKIDDDRAKMIRLKSLQVSFLLLIAELLSVALTNITSNTNHSIEPRELFFFAGIGIILYLFLFHLGLYFDFLVEFDDNKTTEEILSERRKTRWGVLAFYICAAITMILLALL